MEKYNGNQKGFIYASCDAKDQKDVLGKYLEPLAADGAAFWWADTFDSKEEKTLARAKAVLLFLTKDYAKDKKLRDTVAAAVKSNKPLLCVYLEDVELDAALSMQTEAQQALFVSKYKNDEDFVEELKKAAIFESLEASEEQKVAQKKRSFAVVAAVVIAAILVFALVIKPLMSPKVNAETMEALGLKGLSKEELESIEELRVVGTDVVDFDVHAVYEDGNTERIEYQNMDYDDEGVTEPGTISDLSGLEQMTNLKVLMLEGQQIDDITPLLGLENIEKLSLCCNPISSLDGLENISNLESLDIASTNVAKLPDGLHVRVLRAESSALSSVPDFGGINNVEFFGDEAPVSDYSNLGTAGSYDLLSIDGELSGADDIIKCLKGVPVKQFWSVNMDIENLEELDGLNVSQILSVVWSPLKSLDGLENFPGIEMLDVRHCENLTDLSKVNEMKYLKKVRISEDMEELTEGLDDRIEIEIE